MVDYGIKQALFFILIILLILAWFIFLLRAWVRLVILKKVASDDYLMFAAIIFFTGYSAAGFYGVVGSPDIGSSGHGKNNLEMAKEAAIGLKSWWLCEVLYPPVSLLSRTSVAVLLLRIAVERLHRRVIIGVIIAFWLVTIPLFFFMVFQCNPINYFWTAPLPGTHRGTCLDTQLVFVISIAHATISACCDWVLGVLPIVMLWKVRINRKTKASLFVLLSLGMFAGIALLVRIVYLRPGEVAASFTSTQYYSRQIYIAKWSVLEPGLCIIAGCLGTLRPLFSRWDGTWTNIKNGSGAGHMGAHGVYSSNAYRTSKQFQAGRPTGISTLHQGFDLNHDLDHDLDYDLDYDLGHGNAKMMMDLGKRQSVFVDEVFRGKQHLHRHVEENESGSSSSSSGIESEHDCEKGANATNPLPSARPARVRRHSTDSDFSMRFPSFTAPAPLPNYYQEQKQEKEKQQQQGWQVRWPQWHHPRSRNQPEPLRSSPSLTQAGALSIQAPAPALTSGLASFPPLVPTVSAKQRMQTETTAASTTPLSVAALSPTLSLPQPCRVLVQTMTEVEYDDIPGPVAPTTLSMPAIMPGAEGTTMNSIAGDELPKSMTFQGSHTVQITGPMGKS